MALPPEAVGIQRLRRHIRDLVDWEMGTLRSVRARRPVHRREDYEDLPEFRAMRENGRQNMERYERALQFLFEHGGVKLGTLQKRFMEAVRRVSLHRMYGEQLLANMAELRERFGIESVERATCILFPRRSGKTTVQTIDAAVTLVSQPDGNIVCFNLTGRQSDAWMKQTIQYLDIFREAGGEFAWTEVHRHMPERLTIRVHALGTVNTVMAFPGAQAGKFDNIRGMGVRLCKCYLDEAAFFDEGCMPVLAPLLLHGASLILTSSIAPGGARQGLMKILDATYGDGKKAVLEVNMIRACKGCQQRGEEDRCTHVLALPQHFQQQTDVAFVETILSPWAGTAAREIHNLQDKPLMYVITFLLRWTWIKLIRRSTVSPRSRATASTSSATRPATGMCCVPTTALFTSALIQPLWAPVRKPRSLPRSSALSRRQGQASRLAFRAVRRRW